MAYPPAYVRAYSFTDFETTNPGEPKPGNKLDTEYDAVANALTATQTSLALIQRADGELANESVGADQLEAGLFDAIGDAAVADAEAAAAAAAGSASAAAGSASAAAVSAADAATSAGIASGAAAQAGVSQSIAQGAAVDAADSAADADNSADVAVAAANDTAGSVAATEAAVQRAFEWAELLTGPVLPAPPGWPEAVDDGMFSSKWWAIRAREYNSTETIDLGTAGADIGEAFDIWDAIPGNDLGPGLTYATWGSPPQTYVLTDRSDPSDPASWTNITGGPGPAGPGNTLTIGTVTTGAVGQPADATITGVSPNQVLNLTLPTGATGPAGAIGPAGPPNALSIGTVTTVPDGTPSAANITGTAPTQVLNLTLTAGPQGIQGIQGIQGPVGPAVNVANPTGVVGLVAVNGVATTAPRSDSAPALSQAIAPNWTGIHTFTPSAVVCPIVSHPQSGEFGLKVETSGATPYGVLITAGSVASSAAALWVRSSDAGNRAFLLVQGTALTFGNATDNPTYNFLGTGLTTMGGPLQVNGDHIGLSNTDVYFQMIDTDAAADAKIWWLRNSGGPFAIQTRADSLSAGMNALLFTRVGTAVTQMLVGPDGTAALPAISFFNDNDTGLYRNSPDALAFAIAGARAGVIFGGGFQLDIGAFYAPSGIPTLPSYSFLADGDSGMFLAATGVVSLAAGGVSYFSILDGSGMPVRVNTGQLGVPDGTAAAPAYSFTNDPDTGFYRSSADTIGVVTGGLVRFVFGAQGLQGAQNDARVILADGTAAAPAYTFSSDSDTGIYRHGADTIGFSTAGILRVAVNPTGLYTIDGSVAQPSISFLVDQDTGIYHPNPDQIGFAAGGAHTLTIGSGFTNVSGTAFFAAGAAATPSISFAADQDTGIYNAAGNVLGISTAGGEVALFSPVGTRFTAPGVTLQLACNNASNTAYMEFYPSGTVGAIGTRGGYLGFVGTSNIHIVNDAGGVVIMNTTVQAPSFNTTSARASKRETGAPKTPANILARLRPIMYRLLAGGDNEQLGLIAEEVHDVCPQLSDGKTVAYDRLAILLLAAWQDEHLEAA